MNIINNKRTSRFLSLLVLFLMQFPVILLAQEYDEKLNSVMKAMQNNPDLDFEGIYQKTEARFPNAPKICVIHQVWNLHMYTYAAKKAEEEGTGVAYLARFDAWNVAKIKEIWPNGWAELTIVRDGKVYDIQVDKEGYFKAMCDPSVVFK